MVGFSFYFYGYCFSRLRPFTNYAHRTCGLKCRGYWALGRLVVFNVDINLSTICSEHVKGNHYVSQNSLKAYCLGKLFLWEHKTLQFRGILKNWKRIAVSKTIWIMWSTAICDSAVLLMLRFRKKTSKRHHCRGKHQKRFQMDALCELWSAL